MGKDIETFDTIEDLLDFLKTKFTDKVSKIEMKIFHDGLDNYLPIIVFKRKDDKYSLDINWRNA